MAEHGTHHTGLQGEVRQRTRVALAEPLSLLMMLPKVLDLVPYAQQPLRHVRASGQGEMHRA